jgi:ferredoxin
MRAMAITRVWIEEGCISCGMSEDSCPEVFKVKEVATAIEGWIIQLLKKKLGKPLKVVPLMSSNMRRLKTYVCYSKCY